MIALHPFYELNGRITRLFFDLIAVANGYAPIDYSKALLEQTATMNTYIQASIVCVQQADSRMLQQIVLQGLNRLDATTCGRSGRKNDADPLAVLRRARRVMPLCPCFTYVIQRGWGVCRSARGRVLACGNVALTEYKQC